jgi:pantetheine-phosphate adenylyltransferase
MTTAVYAGSFDPITNAHLDLAFRSLKTFDKVIVASGVNPKKTPFFPIEQRLALIRESIDEQWAEAREKWGVKNVVGHDAIEVTSFTGLLVDFCQTRDATVIIRGLRAVTDFEAELTLAQTNARLAPGIETHFLPTKPNLSIVSSSAVREIAQIPSATGWDALNYFVPKAVLRALRAKFPERLI